MRTGRSYKVIQGDRFPLEARYGDGSADLCTVTWKCRWYFNDDKSRPRGFKVLHTFNKVGRVIAQYHIKNKIDGSRMDGYTIIDVLPELKEPTVRAPVLCPDCGLHKDANLHTYCGPPYGPRPVPVEEPLPDFEGDAEAVTQYEEPKFRAWDVVSTPDGKVVSCEEVPVKTMQVEVKIEVEEMSLLDETLKVSSLLRSMLKRLTEDEIHLMMDLIAEEKSDQVLRWANKTFKLETGDLQMDGPDDWWIENEELEYK